MRYLDFLAVNRRFLAFGFAMAFFSAFGQTFFIAVFGGELRAEFALSHGEFGSLYSLATVASGVILIWAGRQIDRFPLALFSGLVCGLLALACLSMAWAPSLAVLGLAIVVCRLAGQGLMSHTALTSMARHFERDRGKAISIANLGFPTGQAAFPIIAVSVVAAIGWRQTWLVAAALVVIGVLPLTQWLLRGHGTRDRGHRTEGTAVRTSPAPPRPRPRQWTRAEVLRDRRFHLVLPAAMFPSFVGTGIIFHQVHLVTVKGWSLEWFAGSFAGLAAASVVSALLAGPLVDRYGAARLLVWTLLPEGVALALLAGFDHPMTALAMLVMMGLGTGAFRTVTGALWAELYGVDHLGAIRAMVAALMVFASAGSPVTMGWLIDAGVSIEAIAVMCIGYLVVAMTLGWIGLSVRSAPEP
jgi:MFS family permease